MKIIVLAAEVAVIVRSLLIIQVVQAIILD